MKKIILILMTVVIAGCSGDNGSDPVSDDELGNPNNDLIVGTISSIDNVSVWQKEYEIKFTDYYSLIDTVIAAREIVRDIRYYCDENENVSVRWSINGNVQSNTTTGRRWEGDIQKWLVINTATLNIDGIDKNLKIEAIVQFPNKSVRRAKTIPKITTIKDISDAFGFIFGMNRTDLNNIIGHDFSPQFASTGLNLPTQSQPFSHFEFSNGKLIRLYLLIGTQSNPYISIAIYLADRCKIPVQIEITGRIIQNPQEWTFGKLKFKADTKDFSDLGLSSNWSYISIEKIQ